MVTRITNNMIARQVTQNLQNNLRRLSQLQMQLSTTKQFNKPSDAPIDYAQSLDLREVLLGERRYVENIERGTSLLNLNDTTLGGVNEVIQRARELALEGANDTLDPDVREALAAEVDELLDQVVGLANTTMGGIYVYGGNRTGRLPFEIVGAGSARTVRYYGDQGTRRYEVGQGVTVSVLLDGVTAFLGEGGTITSTQLVADTTAAIDTQLAGGVPVVTSGTFSINGTVFTVDVTTDSLETIQDRINQAEIDAVASIDAQGRLEIKSLSALDVHLEDGTSNILQGLGMHRRLSGSVLGAPGSVTPATTLAGLGITPGGLRLTVGDEVLEIDLSAAVTVDDVLTTLNGLGQPINAFINADGSGIEISATETVESLEIADMSRVFGSAIGGPGITTGTTLASLGIAVPLGSIEITNGSIVVEVDLSSATTVGDVLLLLNASDAGVQAEINAAGTGIDVLNLVEVQDLQIAEVGAGTTAAALGILGSDTLDTAADLGLVGQGTVSQVESANIFKALLDLSSGLRSNAVDQVEDALNLIDVAFELNNDNRSTVGARTNRMDLLLNRYADSDLFLSQLISENEDIDLAETATDLATQQTVLEAALSASASLLSISLLDFLPV